RLVEIVKQRPYEPISIVGQVILIYSGMRGFLDLLYVEEIASFKDFLLSIIYAGNNTALFNTYSLRYIILDSQYKTREFTNRMFEREVKLFLYTVSLLF